MNLFYCAANVDGVEVRRFEHDIRGGIRDARGGAAHHAGKCDWALAVGDHQRQRIERRDNN